MTGFLFILAAAEANDWAQWAFNILYGIAMAYVVAKTRRIETLETKLEAKQEQEIAQRFAVLKSEIQLPIKQLDTIVGEVRRRLDKGDEAFDGLGERDQRMQIEVLERIGGLKDFIHETFVTREDFTTFCQGVSESIRKMSDQLDQVQRNVVHNGGGRRA